MADPGRVPGVVRDVELSEPLPAVPGVDPLGRRAERLWLLVRLFTEPLGLLVLELPAAGLSPRELASAVDEALGGTVRDRVAAAGGHIEGAPPVTGITAPGPVPYLAGREAVLRVAPPVTVIVCTRDRPEHLVRCLDSLLAQDYPTFRILVVDNAPAGPATAEVVRAAAGRGPVDYVVEQRPGVSFARNRGIAAAPGQILAWIDDDVVADRHWLSELARALADNPRASVVCGAVVPAEIETDAQRWFEEFGGHSKGRGFTPDVFSPATAHVQDPLYPLPAFGAGANMAFRPGVLDLIGGFDPALGTGSPAMGSEDTHVFTRVLRLGGTIVYQPSALVWHYHRRDLAGLRKQLVGYGRGLTAEYTSLVLHDPRVLISLIRLAPTALRDLFGGGSLRVATLGSDFPRELLAANRRGMIAGPFAYLRGRVRNRARPGDPLREPASRRGNAAGRGRWTGRGGG